jgi:hypothetical protein
VRSPQTPPRSPLPPRRRNRPRVPSVTVVVADSPAGSELRRLQIRRRVPSSGEADPTAEILVSTQSFPPPPIPRRGAIAPLWPASCACMQAWPWPA